MSHVNFTEIPNSSLEKNLILNDTYNYLQGFSVYASSVYTVSDLRVLEK